MSEATKTISAPLERPRDTVEVAAQHPDQINDGLPAALASTSKLWLPRVAWSEVPQREREKAVKLQRALAPMLQSQPPSMSASLAAFKQEFGFAVSERHLRRLVHRTAERDGGAGNWGRPELYLHDRAMPRKRKALREESKFDHSDVGEIASEYDFASVGAEARLRLWRTICAHYQEQAVTLAETDGSSRARRELKESLLSYLASAIPAGILAPTNASLRRRLNEKLSVWQASGEEGLKDKRENSGRKGETLCPQCRPLLIGGAVDLDGNKSLAWHRLITSRKFCTSCLAKWEYTPRKYKGRMPRSVERDVSAEITMALPHRRGPHHARLIAPWSKRDWSSIGPGDYFVCDDATPDHAVFAKVELPLPLAYNRTADGIFVGRLEALFICDERTDYPIAYLLIVGDPRTEQDPQRKASYNMFHQRQLLLRAHDKIGLPHCGFRMENGPWRNRLNDGGAVQQWDTLKYPIFANGIESTGRLLRRTRPGNPRSKIIERVFGAIWSRTKCMPGYLGSNERLDRREAVQEFIARVKSGKEDPASALLSVDQFNQTLSAELMAFAADPQNGERLPGVSPQEAWLNGIGGKPGYKDRPCEQLGDAARFLLSTHERVATVGPQGIIIRLSESVRTRFNFWGPELEPYQHQKVICRFNIEEPSILACRTGDGKQFIMKARTLLAEDSSENIARAERDKASWTRRGKVIFDKLPHPFASTIVRDTTRSEDLRKSGADYEQGLDKARVEISKEERERRGIDRKLNAAGLSSTNARRNDIAEQIGAAERLASFMEDAKDE